MVGLLEIKTARENIAGFVHRTPLLSSQSINSAAAKNLWFKAECFQKTGSFKARGASNKIKTLASQKVSGVITISSGNHGQATAYVAGRLGIPAVIFVPDGTPQPKIDAARAYGAEVITGGDLNNVEPLIEKAFALAAERKLEPIHPFEDPLIIAGQGTLGLEILEDLSDVDIVTVPVGGGGLLAGVAVALKESKPGIKVFGIGPANASSIYISYRSQRMETLHDMPQTIADGIRSPIVSQITLEHTLKYVDDIITVADDEIMYAMNLSWSRLKVVVEPAGASSLAAVISNRVPVPQGAKVVCVFSGGNVDFKKVSKLLAV
ncbi:MAG: threonine/serine dehydratase [Dehalococcoidia bacterium]|nr:threonine/serine dehydratase [Dehalococcoidia bacterium]